MPTDKLKIRLVTRELEHVADIEVLPFAIMPDVIIWGNRSFLHYNVSTKTEGIPCYVEGFMYWVPPQEEKPIT